MARPEMLRTGDIKRSCDSVVDILIDDYQVKLAGITIEYGCVDGTGNYI